MQLVFEAGVFGTVIVVVFVAALAARVTGRATSSTPWVLALLSLGAVGQGHAQREVRDAILRVGADIDEVALIAVGTAEASANLLLAGAAGLLVLLVGAARDRASTSS